MKVNVSKEVLETLKGALEDEGKNAVRFEITGFGWGGPTFGIVLDEQNERDSAYEIDGVKFVAEEDFAFLIEGLKLDVSGGKVIIKTDGCC